MPPTVRPRRSASFLRIAGRPPIRPGRGGGGADVPHPSTVVLIEVAAGLAGLLGREPGDLGTEIEQGLQILPDVAILEVEHLVQAARLRDLARGLALAFGGLAGPLDDFGRGLFGAGLPSFPPGASSAPCSRSSAVRLPARRGRPCRAWCSSGPAASRHPAGRPRPRHRSQCGRHRRSGPPHAGSWWDPDQAWQPPCRRLGR